jgi:hypothetical protein
MFVKSADLDGISTPTQQRKHKIQSTQKLESTISKAAERIREI